MADIVRGDGRSFSVISVVWAHSDVGELKESCFPCCLRSDLTWSLFLGALLYGERLPGGGSPWHQPRESLGDTQPFWIDFLSIFVEKDAPKPKKVQSDDHPSHQIWRQSYQKSPDLMTEIIRFCSCLANSVPDTFVTAHAHAPCVMLLRIFLEATYIERFGVMPKSVQRLPRE